jgi:hypothetical protein
MLDGPSIPVGLAKEIYEVYCELYGRYTQSFRRIRERGGFGYSEIKVFMEQRQTKLERKAAK